jgi:hypothetical protein
MTPPQDQQRSAARPRSATPAERSVEFAAIQDQLKKDAAERRLAAEKASNAAPPPQARKPMRRG